MNFFTVSGNPSIEISRDELRSLLGEIEAELYRSNVYQRALSNLQKLLGESAGQAKVLFKAVTREAIGLALRQFSQHPQEVSEDDVDENLAVEKVTSNEVLPDSPCGIFHQLNTEYTAKADKAVSTPEVLVNTANHSVKTQEHSFPESTLMNWLKPNNKLSKAEQAKQTAAQQRSESLRQVGEQLRQAREFHGLSLEDLHLYTHVPIHQMQAVENGNWELLPEEVFVSGFIRLMGNAVGLDGSALSASLPAPDPVKSVLPSWYQTKNTSSGRLGLEIRPMHLYLSYTALIAGAVGGLSLISQQASTDRAIQPDTNTPPSSSVSKSYQEREQSTKPGLQSKSNGVIVGPDISPPEAL